MLLDFLDVEVINFLKRRCWVLFDTWLFLIHDSTDRVDELSVGKNRWTLTYKNVSKPRAVMYPTHLPVHWSISLNCRGLHSGEKSLPLNSELGKLTSYLKIPKLHACFSYKGSSVGWLRALPDPGTNGSGVQTWLWPSLAVCPWEWGKQLAAKIPSPQTWTS